MLHAELGLRKRGFEPVLARQIAEASRRQRVIDAAMRDDWHLVRFLAVEAIAEDEADKSDNT